MTFEQDFSQELLSLIFNNESLGLYQYEGSDGPVTGSASAGNVYIGLYGTDIIHDSKPTVEAGLERLTQDVTKVDINGLSYGVVEATYDGYHRVAIPRSSAEWSIISSQVSNINEIVFPTVNIQLPSAIIDTPGQEIFYWAIGTESTGPGKILYWGTLTGSPVSFVPVQGMIPRIAAGTLVIVEG